MQTNYRFKPNQHYLIHGYSFDNYGKIRDLLIDSLAPYYNEIIYFDTTNHSININTKTAYEVSDLKLNIFEYYNDGKMHDIDSKYRYLTSLILSHIPSKPRIIQFLSVQNLLSDIYTSKESVELTIELFISILEEIIEKSNKKEYKKFFNILTSIDKIKQENPSSYTTIDKFQKLAYSARLNLEEFLFINKSESSIVSITFENYIFNKEIITFFKKLKDNLVSINDRWKKSSKTSNIVKNKINYFTIGLHFDHVKIFLEFLAYRKKMNVPYRKPLIIIQGRQKTLFNSEYITASEIFDSADLCFIITSQKELDENINQLIDIKIFEEEHKNLSLKGKPINRIKFGNYKIFSVSK